jgi:hypothetical protein
VYAPQSVVASLLQESSAKITNVNGAENIVVVGDSSTLRKLEFALRTREICCQFVSQPRIQSLIPFLSDSCIYIFLCFFILLLLLLALQQYQNLTQNIKALSPVIPLAPQRPTNYFKDLSSDLTNIHTTTQKLESGTVVLELNMASVTSAFLRRLNRSSTSVTVIPSYRTAEVSANQLRHVIANLYLHLVRISSLCIRDIS